MTQIYPNNRESSVIVNNNNTNTYTKHLTHNTSFAQATNELCIETSSSLASPSSTSGETSSRNGFARLRKKELAAAEDFKAKKDLNRAKYQNILDSMAKALSQRTEDLYRIEITTRYPKSPHQLNMNIDILTDAGNKYQHYSATCQNRRARDLTANILPKYLDWWGYQECKQAIADERHAGKVKIKQTRGKKTRISPKIVPKCAVEVMMGDTGNPVVRFMLNDLDYYIELFPYVNTNKPESMEYYEFKGVLQIAEEMLDDEI